MKEKEIIVNGKKQDIVIELDDDYYEENYFSNNNNLENTLEIPDINLEDTIDLNNNLIGENYGN